MSDIAFRERSRRSQLSRLRVLAEAALGDYGLEGATLTPVQYWLNTTYRVDSERGRFALRIHRAGEEHGALIRSEVAWLTALRKEVGLEVPQPVPAMDGEPVARVQVDGVPGARFCTVFKWQEGQFLGKFLTPKHVRRAGQLLALMHLHSEAFAPPHGFARPTWDASAFMGSTLNVDLDRCRSVLGDADWSVVEEFEPLLRERMDELERSPDMFGLIHGDFHQDNYLFRGDKVRVIDFDFCGWGYYHYDIAVAFSTLVDRHPNYEVLRRAFWKGYRSKRSIALGDRNLEAVEMFIAARNMARALWLADNAGLPGWEGSESRIASAIAYARRYLTGRL